MPKILIVDDEEGIRGILRITFGRAGYEVRTAADPCEAIRCCEAEAFDVVLSDVVMPSMNGHELACWVAERYPSTRTVLMSGYDLGCQKCAYAPRCKLLAKPFRPQDAVQLVTSILTPA